MPPDAERVLQTRAWLATAVNDERAAIHEFEARPPLTGDICFHAQQLAEKVMKDYLFWNGIPFQKTHDLTEIGNDCVRVDPSLESFTMPAESLTVFAWIFRYPGEPDEPTADEARRALETAQRLKSAILERLPESCRV